MVAQTKRRPVQPGQKNLALIFFLAKLAKQDLHATERNELGFDGSDGKNVPVKMKHLQGNAMCPISPASQKIAHRAKRKEDEWSSAEQTSLEQNMKITPEIILTKLTQAWAAKKEFQSFSL